MYMHTYIYIYIYICMYVHRIAPPPTATCGQSHELRSLQTIADLYLSDSLQASKVNSNTLEAMQTNLNTIASKRYINDR